MRDDEPSGPLAVACTLAAVAGFVDSHLFLHLQDVFVANQSGNIVLFGMAVGGRRWHEAASPALSIALFICGMACATVLHDRRLRRGRPRRPDVLLGAEAVLIGVVVLLVHLADGYQVGGASTVAYLAIAVGAFAMGIQTAVVRRVGDIAVATTYESGTLASLGEQTVLAETELDPVDRRRRRSVLVVLGSVVVSYAGGAAVAAALPAGAWVLGIAAVVLVVTAGWGWWAVRAEHAARADEPGRRTRR